MTNIDVSKNEYNTKFAGLKNSGRAPFTYTVPAQSLPGVPNPGFQVLVSSDTDIDSRQKIADFQVSFPGIDDRNYYFMDLSENHYDSNYNLLPGPNETGIFVSIYIYPTYKNSKIRFVTYLVNDTVGAINTREFTVTGVVDFFEAPFNFSA